MTNMDNKIEIEKTAYKNYYKELACSLSVVMGIFTLVGAFVLFNIICRHEMPSYIQNTCFFNFDITDLIELAGLAVAVATMLSARKIAEMSIANRLFELYARNEMCNYIRILGEIDIPSELSSHIRTREKNEYCPTENIDFTWSQEQDEARRCIKMYYHRALSLYMKGYIKKDVIDMMCQQSAFKYLFEVIEPMEKCLNPEYDSKPFHDLMELCGGTYRKREGKINDKNIHPSPVGTRLKLINIVTDLLDKYGEEEMQLAVREIGKIELPNELKFGTRTPSNNYYHPQKEKDKFQWTDKQDLARRKVKMYYLNAWKLYNAGYIRKDELEMLASQGAFSLLFNVIEPMEKCLNADYDKKFFADMMALCGKYYKHEKDKIDNSRILKGTSERNS